jgi:hypothetical protein
MESRLGNPKSVYLFDIDSSCTNYENDIISSLDLLSSSSGINFIRVPAPFALILGGIGYSCGNVGTHGAIGESEGGMVGVSFIIVSWNQIRLLDTSKEVILHETLHSLGFAHSANPNSIMYPILSPGISQIDPDIIGFLKTYYVANPFAYLNILTTNMISGAFIVFLILVLGLSGRFKK